jgi:hypothetical protein
MSQDAEYVRPLRTGQRLRRIATLADVLREARGDTEWTDSQREAVDNALHSLESIPTQIDSSEAR